MGVLTPVFTYRVGSLRFTPDEWADRVMLYRRGYYYRGPLPPILADLGDSWLEIRAPAWAPVDLVGTRRWFAGSADRLVSIT